MSAEKGFTLLEVMVAMAIAGIALVALLALANRSVGVQERLQRITQATLLAQEILTGLETEAWQGRADLREEEKAFAEPFSAYRWRTTYEDTPIPAVKMVRVSVLWGEEKKNESVEMTSFVPVGIGR